MFAFRVLLVALFAVLLSDTALAAPKCGNGVRNQGEQCDGAALGGATCTSLGFDGGTLGCTATCTYDTSQCDPTATDLLVGQVTYDPTGTENLTEFVDLYNPTNSTISLDGWTLSDNTATWALPAGTTVGAHSWLSVARDAAGFEAHYGLVPDVSGMTLALGNSGDTVLLRNSGVDVDRVSWEGFQSGWNITANDGQSIERTDPTIDTDSVGDWFVKTPAAPRGGTFPIVCGDGLVEGTEQCDGADLEGATCNSLGYDTGTLACSATCTFDTSDCHDFVCGDDVAEGGEACDGTDLAGATCGTFGFDTGTLSCAPTCAYDTSACVDWVCGNDVAEGTEACDGTDLRGATCTSLGYTGGTLSCGGTCGYDTSGCTSGPPVCGDNVVNGDHEECDGSADAACPGDCSDDCACPSVAGTGELELHMIDVGQGESVLVVSPDGFTLLFDAGVDSAGGAVNDYLTLIGIPELDYTVVSHMHADHLGGMDTVLLAHPEVVASFDHGESYGTGEYTEYDVTAGTRRTAVTPGTFVDLGPSMTAEVVHAWQNSSNENDNSVVLKLTYGSLTYLLGGDCEATCESTYDPGHITVYQAHHHGSSDSSSEAFLDKITPETALIPVGSGNPYGHPSQATLDRFAAHSVDVWRTDLDGDIEVLATQASYTVNGQSGGCVPEICSNGVDDDCDGLTDGADPECASGVNHLLVWQVHYDTAGTDSVEESVDLYNPTASPVAVGGWTLTDNVGTWTIPAGTVVPANDWITIAANAAGFQALFGFAPDVAGMTLALGNTGDRMILEDGSGAEVDRCAWENADPGWPIASPTGASIERTSTAVDTDTVNDWAITNPAAPRGGL